MRQRVVFRVDASLAIGTGHVMRCLTLADALRMRGAECHFVTRDLPGHLGSLIAQRGFGVSLLPAPSGPASKGAPAHATWAGVSWEQDITETLAVISSANWLVVDHYAFGARWQQELGNRVGQIMVIDDLADRSHVAAVLLDQNLGSEATDYEGLLPKSCRLLTGPRYALLRPEFAAQREAALARRHNTRFRHLMITMGGTDPIDASSTVLRALKRADLPQGLRISVVMGSRAPALAAVREVAASMPLPTEVLVDVRDMATMMADADLAITAGGSTNWERCCLGLPGIVIETAENQARSVTAMIEAGVALGSGSLSEPNFADSLLEAVRQMQDTDFRTEISKRAASICAGNGAMLIADFLGEEQWK